MTLIIQFTYLLLLLVDPQPTAFRTVGVARKEMNESSWNYLRQSAEITNKMQPCNRIYYSKIYWRLNMFRAAYRSSSGAPNCICNLWFIYPCGDRPLSRLGRKFPPSLHNVRSPHGYINQRLQIQFGAPDDERYAARKTFWAFNKFWYNKFY